MFENNKEIWSKTIRKSSLTISKRNAASFGSTQKQPKDEILLLRKSLLLRAFIRVFRFIIFVLNYNDFLRINDLATETKKRPIGSP